MQYIMVDVELINNPNITNDEVIAYSLLCDRMRSSKRSRSFFDIKLNDYYVIYTINEMAKKLKVSVRKVNHIFKKLVTLGLLAKKKQFSRADKLFLPKFSDPLQEPAENVKTQSLHQINAESAGLKTQNLQPNQSDLNHNNQSEIDTVNTSEPEKETNPAIEKWKHAVCNKIKIQKIVVERILKFTHNDVKKAHKIIGIILKAKNNIAKQNDLSSNPISRFENNTNLGTKLALKLSHIFNYLPANLEEQCKYLMSAMKTFFLDAFGLKKDELVTPNAPSQVKKRAVPVPFWMKSDQEDTTKPTEAEKAEIAEMLKKFD
ncbi:hypothetical protein ACYATO_08980 [Lactobacillaceae bacterium Melli_B3]